MENLLGVLWDMDGVLVDTGEFHYQSWTETLAEYGIPLPYEQFRTTFGMNNEGILRMLLGERYTEELFIEISERKETRFREMIHGQVQLLPGVRPLLEALREANVPQAIASSAPQANIETILFEFNLESYFQALVSAVGLPSKPHPAVFLAAAQRLDLQPGNCIVLEDAIPGVEAARRAGMRCVAVTTTNKAEDLGSADLVVDRLDMIKVADLMALLD